MTYQQSTGKLRVRHHCFKRTSDSTVFCFRCWKEKALGRFTRGNHAKVSWDTCQRREETLRSQNQDLALISWGRRASRCIGIVNDYSIHHFMVEIGSLATSPTAENRIAEAFKIVCKTKKLSGLTRKQVISEL